jgi:hypothetical protein
MKIAYYIVTVIFSLFILLGSFYDIQAGPAAVEVMQKLGYPIYLLYIVGYAKILGIIGIWQNKVKFLREWAYAGLVIDLVGAFISHLAVGDGLVLYSGSLIGIVLVTASYILFKKTEKTA